jgi:hypothetical protein
LLVSTGLATFQLIRTRRLAPAVAPLVTGFLIDVDHFAEVVRYRRNPQRSERLTVLPLHGWEFLLVWFLLDRLFGRRLAGGLTLGYAAHLAIDQLTNTTTHPLTYFITFRWCRGFPSKLFSHRDEKQIDWLNDSVFNVWKYF